MESVLLVDRRDGWTLLTLNRPDRLNSFNEALHLALRDALDAVAAEESCRAVLLTGAGRGFCAGQDLSARVGLTEAPDLGATIETFYNPLVRRIRALNKPVICAVNGVAAGAGANIALACDIVLAAKSAKFIQAFSKIGLVPDSGGTFFLPRLVGDARARALMMLAEPVSATQAADWGMIWKAVEDADLPEVAAGRAAALANGPTEAYRNIKQAMRLSLDQTFEEQMQTESHFQGLAGKTRDFREGVMAFLEKRSPKYEGR